MLPQADGPDPAAPAALAPHPSPAPAPAAADDHPEAHPTAAPHQHLLVGVSSHGAGVLQDCGCCLGAPGWVALERQQNVADDRGWGCRCSCAARGEGYPGDLGWEASTCRHKTDRREL